MYKNRRYRIVDMIARKGLCLLTLTFVLTGCAGKDSANVNAEVSDRQSDFSKIRKKNSDAFAWINIPGTVIDYPVLQSEDGDDSFYKSHNELKKDDEKGAIYIEAANLKDMCDFNEVVHGSSPLDGSMFAGLDNFLDKEYFDQHKFIYVYTEDNSLIYYIAAAFARDDTRLLEQYDFSYASGCSEFIEEIYDKSNENKLIREDCESVLEPEHFLITLSSNSKAVPGKQIVVVGCLVGDAAGKIDRYVDYGNEE